MDFDLSEDQRAIAEAVESLLAKHAGPARAIALEREGAADAELEAALADAGFLEIATGEETGLLEAALVVEAVARAGGVVSIGAAALVAPGLTGGVLPGPIAICRRAEREPVRFAAQARTLIVDDGDEARVLNLAPGAHAQAIRSNFMLPLGRFAESLPRGEGLGPGSGERLRRFWRLALAAESVGLMRGALELTVGFVKRRRQFGRAIGSFQAVQHRLAECAVLLEGSRWLTLEAAAHGAQAEATALAAAHACTAANRIFAETHQLSGAMGFTREHDLHVFSMRLQILRRELGGAAEHRRAAAHARWRAPGAARG
jgi:alkylation response protein AidB-like acyl-CoA dehydrogenase